MRKTAWCQSEKMKFGTWILNNILALFFRTFEIVSDMVFELIYSRDSSENLPPIKNPILLESASSLAIKIRLQKVTSLEVVEAFIERIKEINSLINCAVDFNFKQALEEAKLADETIKSGKKDVATLELETPFLGVPFTIKDCFAVKGMKNTAGHVGRKNMVPDFDANVVSLMKKSGAIILAVTNVSELCMWWESSNYVYGRSRNPYNFNRIVGGSSGGEGGLLTAGGSPFGIGSDIGGSIRMPSLFNGIFGHKPTTGIVSNVGQQPVAEKVLDTFLVTGPMSRYCADLLPMYRILAADNINKLKLDEKVNISQLRVFYMEDFGNVPLISRVHPDMKKAQLKVVRHFEEAHGIKVTKVQMKQFFHAAEMWLVKMSTAGVASFAQELALRQGEVKLGAEFLKWCVGLSNHTLPAIGLGLLEKCSLSPTHPTSHAMVAMCDNLLRQLQEMLGNDGILLVPTHPTPALYHNQPLCKPMNAAYTAIFNVLGLPVTHVPLGLGSWGVPVGVQVISSLHNDHVTLAVAAELERAFGGWVPPCQILF